MQLKAIKMHCQGNDYIFLDLLDVEKINHNWNELAIKLSDRHFGIGGDGLVLIQKSNESNIQVHMRIFNSDGSEAETCGTALLCITHYLFEKLNLSEINISTAKRTYTGYVNQDENIVSVNMGIAKFTPFSKEGLREDLLSGYLVNINNQHFVTFDTGLLDDIADNWKELENHPNFQVNPNIERVKIINNQEIEIKIWERGAGFTLCCGSGACAAAYVAHKMKNLDHKIKVNVPGGQVMVKILPDDSCILSGNVTKVFETVLS